ncbi:MAG TPA: sulfotransferase family 2 domain-containing protein [Bacteroidia bacterium]|nr:sulfotransferase family 2 domain-containing protein [Bacteroidia bacterium]
MISHKHQFIFVHINNTGGTSIETLFYPDASVIDVPEKHEFISYYKLIYPFIFDKYFKFSIVRNPWDRMVSQYLYRKKHNKDKILQDNRSFSDWARDPGGHLNPQLEWVTASDYNGNKCVMVDFIGRFETLSNDWKFVCKQLNLDQQLPHVNNNSEGKHYSQYYDAELVQLVKERFQDDIEYFNYSFDSII